MKPSRGTPEQMAFAIKQHGLGTRVEVICRNMGISDSAETSSQTSKWPALRRAANQ